MIILKIIFGFIVVCGVIGMFAQLMEKITGEPAQPPKKKEKKKTTTRKIRSRKMVTGSTYYYDEKGRVIGKSRPGAFLGQTIYRDARGKLIGTSRPGAFLDQEIYRDTSGKMTGTSRPGAFWGRRYYRDTKGKIVGKSRPGAVFEEDRYYTLYEEDDTAQVEDNAELYDEYDDDEVSYETSIQPTALQRANGVLAILNGFHQYGLPLASGREVLVELYSDKLIFKCDEKKILTVMGPDLISGSGRGEQDNLGTDWVLELETEDEVINIIARTRHELQNFLDVCKDVLGDD